MKRTQRKANLKKLLAQNGQDNNRRQLRSSKSDAINAVSNNFIKDNITAPDAQDGNVNIDRNVHNMEVVAGDEINAAHAHTLKRRVNLTRFLFKNKSDIPPHLLKTENDSDDFETPVKRIKRAPKLSQPTETSRTTRNERKGKRQQKITTAFLRNEQMFSEIAAQHSVAENFNPDEVQLALALSRSELETKVTNECSVPVDSVEVSKKSTAIVDDDIRSKLKKFGFRTANKEDYKQCFAAVFLNGQRRTKTKWANKFTALTLRDPEVQLKKISAYIETILKQRFNTTPPNEGEHSNKSYSVQSSMLSKHAVVDESVQIFRNMERLSTTQQLESYFVTELFPVARLPAGHLLKDWTIIPGRDLSPEREFKRLSAQARKYKKFYEELERYFWNGPKDLPEDNEKILSTIDENKGTELTSTNELDHLLELIENAQNETEAENAIHFDKEQCAAEIQMSTSVKHVDIIHTSSTETCPNSQTQIRSTSPDIFADSDSDDAVAVEENKSNDITTYEVYSSDDVKTSFEAGCKTDLLSVKADVIVDLTQDDVNELVKVNIPSSHKHDISKRLDFLDVEKEAWVPLRNTSPIPFEENEHFQMETDICNMLGVRPLNEMPSKHFNRSLPIDSGPRLNKSCSNGSSVAMNNSSQEVKMEKHNETLLRNDSTASIDLTQSDDENTPNGCNGDNDEDDVCILLSDDEVNYSIMKASAACSKLSASTVENSDNSSDDENAKRHEKSLENADEHNFSVLDLIDVEHSFQVNEMECQDEILSKKASFNLSGDLEPINKEYLTTDYPRTPAKEFSISNMLKQQRAEFGILESQSESFSQSPPHWMKTPAKMTPQKETSPPSSSTYEPQQRYSRHSYSRKFQSFLFEVPKTPNRNVVDVVAAPEYDDFDEFDRLVYGSPPKRAEVTSQCDVPAGLTQLLTAEINLDAQYVKNAAESQSPSSLVLKTLTPEKAAAIVAEEEIRINNHIYTVRVTNSPKPNFATQSEAELLKRLYNYGIKPLKRNQAVKLLEYIYNETHPIIESTICNDNDIDKIDGHSPEFICSENVAVAKKTTVKSTTDTSNPKKLHLQDCYGDILLRFTTELSAELRNDEEVYIFQTNVTKKTQHPLLPLHIAWYNLVCSSTALHESILMYEPIDLQEIYLFLKSLGYRYDPKDLKGFFDRRCIIFRYDLTPPEKQANRHIRKANKKPKDGTQRSANSQHTLHKYLSL